LAPARKPPSFLPRRLAAGERSLGAIRDKASLELSHESHLLQHEAAGGALDLRQILEPDVHAGIEQYGEKSDRAGEPIGLRPLSSVITGARSKPSPAA
jgi:hypothetical protein